MSDPKEYIDRGLYCETICRCNGTACDKSKCPIWNAPAADVAPVVHGEWMVTVKPIGDSVARRFINTCSVCGGKVEFLYREHRYEYCPHCGAKMDGGSNGR